MAFAVKAGAFDPLMVLGGAPSRSPGPLGINDWGDPSLLALRGLLMPHAGGLCTARDGVALALGFMRWAAQPAASATAAAVIALNWAQEMALKITTDFEVGKSMNYQALADDFDGQGTSFGLIQWNFGQNTLGPLLKKMKTANATGFAGCFGEKATTTP